MRSEAVLLVLLAAPCVVESAAAFPPAVVEVGAVIKAMQESNPRTAPTKKGLLAAKDPDKCINDYHRLGTDQAYSSDMTACGTACMGNDWTANALAGTDTTSCNALPACTKFKKTCAAKAGWGFWEDTELTVTFKDSPGLKDSTHAAYGQMRCYPASCEGTEMGSSDHPYEIKEGTTGPTKMEMGSTDGVTYSATTVIEKMPPPMMFYIVIAVAVLALCLTICLIRRGCCRCCSKCCPQGGGGKAAPYADKVQVKEADKEGM
jgi:hypothetical protein